MSAVQQRSTPETNPHSDQPAFSRPSSDKTTTDVLQKQVLGSKPLSTTQAESNTFYQKKRQQTSYNPCDPSSPMMVLFATAILCVTTLIGTSATLNNS